jgi:hypothetical protein
MHCIGPWYSFLQHKKKNTNLLFYGFMLCYHKRGLIYTGHKSSGHHYQGFTHTAMSSAVKTLTQVKVRIGVM